MAARCHPVDESCGALSVSLTAHPSPRRARGDSRVANPTITSNIVDRDNFHLAHAGRALKPDHIAFVRLEQRTCQR